MTEELCMLLHMKEVANVFLGEHKVWEAAVCTDCLASGSPAQHTLVVSFHTLNKCVEFLFFSPTTNPLVRKDNA